MTGVCDEALLLLIAFRDWAYNPRGKQKQEKKNSEDSCQGNSDAGIQEGSEGAEFPLAVEEQQHDFSITNSPAEAVFPGEPFFPP